MTRHTNLGVAFIAAAVLAACGGGGGSSQSANTGVLSGTVATGRPYPEGTLITVTDADGNTVGSGQVTGTTGQYSLTLTNPSARAPLVITASVEGEETLVGIAASSSAGTANITPVTHLIAASLSPTGDPLSLTGGNTTLLTPTAIQTAIAHVNTLISSVSSNTQTDATANPLTTAFRADGTGLDRTLDAVKISVRPQGDNTSRIQIYTPSASDGTAVGGIDNPITLTTSSNQATAPNNVGSLPSVSTQMLPPHGAITKVQDLMSRITACYALPRAERSSGGVMGDACRSLFWTGDPSTYRNNSYVVGTSTSGRTSSWNGIFNNADTTKVVWDQPQILFTSKQSIGGTDVFLPVVQSRWTSSFPCSGDATQTCNNTDIEVYVLRPDDSGKLYLFGNQSGYDLGVTPRIEFRDFPNFSAFSYYNVGYNLNVKDTGQIGKAVVTSPNGKKITLKPIPGGGYSYLGISKGNGASTVCSSSNGYYDCVTTTSVMRLAAAYKNPATTSGSNVNWPSTNHPRDIDRSLAWSIDTDVSGTPTGWKNWSDDELAAIPEQGNWTFEIYDTNMNLVATEQRRTSSRIPTLLQTKNTLWPALAGPLRTLLVSKSQGTGSFTLDSAQPLFVTSDMTSMGVAGWEVATGAWSPTSVKAFGSYYYAMPSTTTSGFDDESTVRSSWRKTTINCSGSDGHCSGSGNYKPYVDANTNYSKFTQLQLNGRDVYRVQNSVSINLRRN